MTWPTKNLENAFVAYFKLGDVVGILGDHFEGSLFDGSLADLGAKAFGGDDFGGAAAGVEHGYENLFTNGGGDFFRFQRVSPVRRERLARRGLR